MKIVRCAYVIDKIDKYGYFHDYEIRGRKVWLYKTDLPIFKTYRYHVAKLNQVKFVTRLVLSDRERNALNWVKDKAGSIERYLYWHNHKIALAMYYKLTNLIQKNHEFNS